MQDDLSQIREGVGSKFTSGLSTAQSMRRLLDEANESSGDWSVEGFSVWLSKLQSLDRELSPFLTKEEERELESVRIDWIPSFKKSVLSQAMPLLRRKLDKYERLLRVFVNKKGFGAAARDDVRTAILR